MNYETYLWSMTMASGVKVEVIHEETIRPSSPTPHRLKTTKLSIFDQLKPEIYVPLLLVYPAYNGSDVNNIDPHSFHLVTAERSNVLKASFSQTLTHFYPFAGQFQCNHSIWCDDHGAKFIEARVNCPISKILQKPDHGILNQLVPVDMASTQAVTGHLLLVQTSFFKCGGMAIGVSISHKVADASTLSAFIKSWATIALGLASTTTDHDHVVLPAEVGALASLFPPLDLLNASQPTVEFPIEKCITRRIVFEASKIIALKCKAASATVPDPTRVEVVSALIWKSAMEASISKLGSARPSAWCQAVNMRKISAQVRPLGENVLGNFVGFIIAKTDENEASDHDLQGLVAKFRKGIEEFKFNYGHEISGDDACEIFKEFENLIKRDDIENYVCTSWCRFPFYTANFGWGKPSWTFFTGVDYKNGILLIDTRDGDGIEASLTLKEEDMALIESNKELLAYASLNPTLI